MCCKLTKLEYWNSKYCYNTRIRLDIILIIFEWFKSHGFSHKLSLIRLSLFEVKDKVQGLFELMAILVVEMNQVAFIGDDLN